MPPTLTNLKESLSHFVVTEKNNGYWITVEQSRRRRKAQRERERERRQSAEMSATMII